MNCDSNSVSLMSIDNSSEPIKQFSPAKFANNSWWEEVEAAEHTVFKQEDAVNTIISIMSTGTTETDKKTDRKMDPDMLTFSNKIPAKAEKVASSEAAVERETPANKSIDGGNSRDISIEFLDSSNGEKYDRLPSEVKSKLPFKRRLSGDSRSNSPILTERDEQTDAVKASSENDCSDKGDGYEDGELEEDNQSGSGGRGHGKRRRVVQELETCAETLARRQKQIDYGKNTIGYDNYIQQIPRNKRTKDHPWTPPKQFKYSRRAFDGLIKVWRTKLHCFDPPNRDKEDQSNSESDEE